MPRALAIWLACGLLGAGSGGCTLVGGTGSASTPPWSTTEPGIIHPAPEASVAAISFPEEAAPPAVQPDRTPGDVPPAPPRPLPPISGLPLNRGGPLTLREVLDSVERHYPLLRAAEQERAIAGGKLISAMGAFDFTLQASAEGQGGTYDNFRGAFGASQPLPIGGIGTFAGYRTGDGDFATYNLGQKTADGGELRAGITVPLLRDRAIDKPRAGLQQAYLDVQLAEPVIERQRLDFQRAAARTFWNWVAAGQRLRVAQSLVDLAVERDAQLKARVQGGPAANIERIDNQQNIALRQGILVQAQRSFQQAAIDLSLFLRNDTGLPTLADASRLPAFPAPGAIDHQEAETAVDRALQLRPELRRLLLQREKTSVELALAQNQLLPSLNAVVAVNQDVGYGKSSLSGPNGLDRSSISAGLAFQYPVQQRDASGRVLALQAQMVQLDQQLRQMEDVIRADVQDTFSALERASEYYQQARQRVELARLVARAEREQLRLGRSDVLRVTLREQAAFEAEVIEINAQQDYFRARADFRAALGLLGE